MIPRVLSDPPWRRAAQTSSKVAETHVTKAVVASLIWEEGEREHFRGKPPSKMVAAAEEKLFEKLLDDLDKKLPLRSADVARLGDEKLAELADELGPTTTDTTAMKMILGRLGDAFITQAIMIVRAAPRERGLFEAAMPIHAPELARNAAAVFFEREMTAAAQSTPFVPVLAEVWMLRHPEAVAAGLASLALGAAPPDPREKLSPSGRAAARAGLAFVAANGKLDAMREVIGSETLIAWLEPFAALAPLANDPARSWGPVLAARGMDHRAIAVLGDAPEARAYVARAREGEVEQKLAAVPGAVAALPAFFDAPLPAPRLLDGTALPEDAVRALGEMLRFSPLGHPYVGVAQVREACDAASLDAFTLALFERWRAAGEDPREAWAFEACGKIGGEASAREVAAHIRTWARGAEPPRYGWDQDAHRVVMISPGSRGFSFARTGLMLLAALGTDFARIQLEDLGRTGLQVWLRKEARTVLGVEGEDIAREDIDAAVPTVGLDADGSATFDTGSRTLRIRFDENLTPYLAEGDTPHKTFPRARKEDDKTKYAAAKDRFGAITKDVKTVARYQVALLERVMVAQRTFPAPTFRERFIAHPLLRHLGRRIVWRAGETTFRVAEDASLADVHDAPFALEDSAAVTVAHPITMTETDRNAWRTRFADYQLLQPFSQLAREIFTVSPAEIGEHDIARAIGIKTGRGRLFQLGRHGWRARFDRPDITEYTREFPCGAAGRFEVSPAVNRDGDSDQVFTVTLATCSYSLDRLPAIDFSELVRDLDYLK